jgi:hypothetical protein
MKDGITDMDEVEIIRFLPALVKTKRLETKRKANYATKHAGDKRRKAEARNDADCVREEETELRV